MAKLTLREDGVDHIRVNLTAATITGRLCVMGLGKEFTIPGIGNFLSPGLFAIWAMTGKNALIVPRNEPRIQLGKDAQKIYNDALWLGKFLQLYSNRDLLMKDANIVIHKLKRIDLPFCDYVIHRNGLKAVLPDLRPMELTQSMVKFIIDTDENKGHFSHGDFEYIEVLARMNQMLKQRKEKLRLDVQVANMMESIHQAHEALDRKVGNF